MYECMYVMCVYCQGSRVEILDPLTFAFLLIGAMLPYWFSAMTMKSVGTAAIKVCMYVAIHICIYV